MLFEIPLFEAFLALVTLDLSPFPFPLPTFFLQFSYHHEFSFVVFLWFLSLPHAVPSNVHYMTIE